MGLGVQGNHFWASRKDVDLGLIRCILVQFQTMAFDLLLCKKFFENQFLVSISQKFLIFANNFVKLIQCCNFTKNFNIQNFVKNCKVKQVSFLKIHNIYLPFHNLITLFTMIGFMWHFVMLVGFAQNQFMVSQSERIPVDGARIEVYVGVAAFGLASWTTVIIPDWQFWNYEA